MSRDLALAQRLATPDRERCKVRTGRAAAAATRSRIGLVSRRPAGSERHEFDVLGAPGDGGDLVLLELAVERLAADPEHPRGERLAPADRLHHTQDVAALDLLERRELGRIVARDEHVRALEAADLLREIVEADRLVPREGDRPLDAVLELAHVAGPDVGEQALRGLGREPGDALAGLRGVAVDEVLREEEHVAAARPQGRHLYVDHVDPEVEILAEAALLDSRLEVAVGRRDQVDVEGHLLVGADGPHAARLERPQELRLEGERQVADLVEEERTPVRLHEEPPARRVRVGEGAARVPEELALEQRLRERDAVDGDEGTGLPPSPLVEGARDELLSGPRLAGDQHGRAGVRDAVEELVHPPHRGAGPEQRAEAAGFLDRLAQPPYLVAQPAVLDCPREREPQGVDLERLGDEVVGAAPERGDRRLDAPKGGDHDHGHIRARRDDALAELEAAHARHVEVGHDRVELRRDERFQRRRRRRARLHLEAELAQVGDEHVAHARIVVDDEDTPLHEATSAVPGSAEARKIATRVPRPGSLSTSIQPPWSVTMPCATESPRPVPSPTSLVVKNGSKMCGRASALMPRP